MAPRSAGTGSARGGRPRRYARRRARPATATVGQLADRLGYRSEAAFSRAFKRVTGVSPGVIRRTAGEHNQALIAAATS
jgi:AraC-like DNA-binding protein